MRQERKDKLLKENETNNNNNDNVENNNNISNQEQQQGPPKEEEKKELSEFEKMKLMMLSAADEYQELRNEYETEFGEQWSPVHKTSIPTGDNNNETSTTANSSPTKVFTFDNVDIETARENGITIYTTPEAPVLAVAEFTLGLILSVLRRITEADRNIRRGNWKSLKGNLLSEQTIGIIGS